MKDTLRERRIVKKTPLRERRIVKKTPLREIRKLKKKGFSRSIPVYLFIGSALHPPPGDKVRKLSSTPVKSAAIMLFNDSDHDTEDC